MNDWIRRIREGGNLGLSQREQDWVLASFNVIGIQKRNACWGHLLSSVLCLLHLKCLLVSHLYLY